MKKTLLIGWLWLVALTLTAQPTCRVVKYDEADGVASAHITQLLQDEQGFMWFATWNGLCRYDGYEFRTFKPHVGDGCHMVTDRIRNITLLPQGKILCRVDNDHYLFDLKSYRFRDVTKEEEQEAEQHTMEYLQSRSLMHGKHFSWTDRQNTCWTLYGDGRLTYRTEGDTLEQNYPLTTTFRTLTFAAPDNQGNLWALDHGAIYHFHAGSSPTQRVPISPAAEVKCLFADSRGHYFICTKGDQAVRVYRSQDNHLLGFLGSDGRIHQSYTSFSAAVYCMYEQQDGTLWLGTKPGGLFRLQPKGGETYKIAHFTDLPHSDVYHIAEDRWGRLWIATLGGGISYTTQPQADHPRFVVPQYYPKDAGQRARYLFLTKDDILLVATGSGLFIARMERNAENMRFQRHQREPDRPNSLSSNATMDIVQDRQGHYFVSTESGGVNRIEGNDLLAPTLTFHHLRRQFHVPPNDIVQSLTATADGGLIAVGSHLITLTDSTTQGRILDTRYFNASDKGTDSKGDNYRFSEAHPLLLPQGQWLFGLMDGAFTTTMKQMERQALSPRVVLTCLEVRGEMATAHADQESEKQEVTNWGIEACDTVVLQPQERNLTIHFAALDYGEPDDISYAFRLGKDEEWNYIGHNRSATLLDLKPGTYLLQIRSTDANGQWQDNIRQLTIIAKPTFWEAWYGQLLILLLIMGALAAIACTLLYIRRIRRQHRETLEKYLALIEERGETATPHADHRAEKPEGRGKNQELDPVIKRVMQFVEENIGNSDAGVGEMAQAAAVSRSGLQRKLKQAMGITPQDLMKEARIKRARQLLLQSDKTVSEVAYACGFTDPKYFSKCFKQSTGISPSEVRGEK